MDDNEDLQVGTVIVSGLDSRVVYCNTFLLSGSGTPFRLCRLTEARVSPSLSKYGLDCESYTQTECMGQGDVRGGSLLNVLRVK